MKFSLMLLILLFSVSCSTRSRDVAWDNGADKQQAVDSQQKTDQQDQFRNQLPSPTNY